MLVWGRGLKCEKLIKYQTRDVSGKGEVTGFVKADFKTKVRLHLKPDGIALSLDDYQYLRCKDAERYDKKDPRRNNYLDKRDIVIELLTNLRTIISSASNSNKKAVQKRLDKLQDVIDDFFQMDALERLSKKVGKGRQTPLRTTGEY